MNILILEPSAIGNDRTHNFKSLVNFTKVFQESGIKVFWMPNIKCQECLPGVVSHPKFKYSIYDDNRKRNRNFFRVIRKIPFVRRLRCRYLIKTNYRDILSILRKLKFCEDDHLFVPTTDWILFKVLLEIINKEDKPPRIHFLFMYESADWLTCGYPYATILKTMKRCRDSKRPVYLYTETTRHAINMGAALQQPISVCPYPVLAVNGDSDQEQEITYPDKFIVGILGGGRRDKGFQRVPDIIQSYNSKARGDCRVEFLIQAPRRQDKLESEVQALSSISNVRILENRIDENQYRQLLQSCHVMLFPYKQEVYHTRGSGVLWEAVANGIPFVCTKNTSLEDGFLSKNGCSASLIPEFSEALIKILRNWMLFKRNAFNAAALYRSRLENHPVVENVRIYRN